MPRYKVRGLKAGQPVRLTVVANNLTEARARLRREGVFAKPEDIQEEKPFFSLETSFDFSMLGSIDIRDKAVFSRQFAALINAGVSMVRSLTIMEEQTGNPKLKKYLRAIRAEVEAGKNLSDSIRPYPDAFDGLYCSMVQAGEVGGVLDEVLNRLAKLLEDMDRLQKQIKSAMTYPVVVTILAVLIFLGMVLFILPTFESIYNDLGGELPGFTQFFINISKFLRTPQYSLGLVGFLVAVFFAFPPLLPHPRRQGDHRRAGPQAAHLRGSDPEVGGGPLLPHLWRSHPLWGAGADCLGNCAGHFRQPGGGQRH